MAGVFPEKAAEHAEAPAAPGQGQQQAGPEDHQYAVRVERRTFARWSVVAEVWRQHLRQASRLASNLGSRARLGWAWRSAWGEGVYGCLALCTQSSQQLGEASCRGGEAQACQLGSMVAGSCWQAALR